MNRMVNLVKVGVLALTLTLDVSHELAAQDKIEVVLLEELISGGMDLLSPEQVLIAERIYSSMALDPSLTNDECLQFERAKAVIVLSDRIPERSNLYSTVIYDQRQPCGKGEAVVQFILGNDCFMRGSFEEAEERLMGVLSDELAYKQLKLTAYFNLIAVYNELGEIDRAIEVANQALEQSSPGQGLFFDHMSINLAGLYNSSHDYARSLELLNEVDDASLDEYWMNIKVLNEFMAHLHLFHDEECRGLWFSHVRLMPLDVVPDNLLLDMISQAMLYDDVMYFRVVQAALQEDSLRLAQALGEQQALYAPLFDERLSQEQFEERWNDLGATERAYHSIANARYSGIIQKKDDRLDNLESKLILAKQEKDEWRQTAIWIIVGINLVLGIFIIRLLNRRNQNRRRLEAALAGNQGLSPSRGFKLSSSELRILGDAVAFGKRTSDAMLLLQKLNEHTEHGRLQIASKQIHRIPTFETLNKSEKMILEHLVSGFESKEIARLMGCSSSHIYNVRSRIRQTFDIPANEGIEDWFNARLSEMPSDKDAG